MQLNALSNLGELTHAELNPTCHKHLTPNNPKSTLPMTKNKDTVLRQDKLTSKVPGALPAKAGAH